jgi:hypothetical protein
MKPNLVEQGDQPSFYEMVEQLYNVDQDFKLYHVSQLLVLRK